MNKRLWTPSFVLVTAAISIGLIALAHVSVDRSRVASTVAFPLDRARPQCPARLRRTARGRRVDLSRARRLGHRVDVAHRARRAAMGPTAGRVLPVCSRDARGLDAARLPPARSALVRDAVIRRWLVFGIAMALCAGAAACSSDDGGSGASSTAAGATTTRPGSTSTTSSGPTTTVLLDKPNPDLSALPTDDLPTGVAEDSPAARSHRRRRSPSGSTSSVPVAPEFVTPATGGEPPTACCRRRRPTSRSATS